MSTCKSCEHWVPWKGYDPVTFVVSEPFGVGECKEIEASSDRNDRVRSYEGVGVEENFGCIHHKSK